MPFETVQYPSTEDPSGTEVSVHWAKDGPVQLHVQRHAWQDLPDTGTVTRRLGEPQEGDPEPLPALTGVQEAEVWTEVLSRDQLNKLIRVLRRARDAAYGADA